MIEDTNDDEIILLRIPGERGAKTFSLWSTIQEIQKKFWQDQWYDRGVMFFFGVFLQWPGVTHAGDTPLVPFWCDTILIYVPT